MIVWNQCEVKKDLTIERLIDNWFDCLFIQSNNANVRKIVKLSEIFQVNNNFAFLSKNRDHSSNQRDFF